MNEIKYNKHVYHTDSSFNLTHRYPGGETYYKKYI